MPPATLTHRRSPNAAATAVWQGWVEVSDTVREVGKSKAALVSQKTRVFQRAVLFAILNPQVLP